MKNRILLMFLLANSAFIYAQIGVAGGLSMINAFGTKTPYMGIHIGGEFPKDDHVTFFAKITTTLANKDFEDGTNYTYITARDQMTIPYQQQIYFHNRMNYNIIEGGTRYYIGTGYDAGFAAYGGGSFALVLNSVKRRYDSYDEVKYELPATELSKGMIFNIGVGATGGLKYTFPGVGSIYFDANFNYLILSQASNATAASVNSYSRLLFNFGIGFRKEFY